jgi:hypothetical protein
MKVSGFVLFFALGLTTSLGAKTPPPVQGTIAREAP